MPKYSIEIRDRYTHWVWSVFDEDGVKLQSDSSYGFRWFALRAAKKWCRIDARRHSNRHNENVLKVDYEVKD